MSSTETLNADQFYTDILKENEHLAEWAKDRIKRNISIYFRGDREFLDLSCCSLEVIPESINQLSFRGLNLGWNKLSCIETICQLTSLTELELVHTELSSVPDSIAKLESLIRLDLDDNKLEVIPEGICNLPSLRHLDLNINQITDIPEGICNLSSLQCLNLGHNQMTTVSDHICHLNNLVELDLSFNKITDIPGNIVKLGSLKKLNLACNKLQSAPGSIAELVCLQELRLGDNEIRKVSIKLLGKRWGANMCRASGMTMDQLIVSTHVDKFYDDILKENSHLTDEYKNKIKAAINDCAKTRYRYLYLNNCDLQVIPDEIGNFTSLIWLSLRGNKLSHIPDTISHLISLETLDLGDNQLSHIPESLNRLISMRVLYLHNNKLRTIPEGIEKIKSLRYLNLTRNSIKRWPIGLLESCWGYNIRKMTGKKKEELIILNKIDQFYCDILEENPHLTDECRNKVLEEIEISRYNKHLDLSACNLQIIPESIDKLNFLRKLDLTNNPIKIVPIKLLESRWADHLCTVTGKTIDELKNESVNMSQIAESSDSKKESNVVGLIIDKDSVIFNVVVDGETVLYYKENLEEFKQVRAIIRSVDNGYEMIFGDDRFDLDVDESVISEIKQKLSEVPH